MPIYTFEYKVIRPRMDKVHSMVIKNGNSYREALEEVRKELEQEYYPTSRGCNIIIKINYLKLFFG